MDGLSLLTNRDTKIHIYEASKIPKPPVNASCALRPPPKKQTARPGDKENAYVSHMYQKIDKDRLPTENEFELMKIRSANVKDKFCELKDVREGRFCDIVARVVKEPYDQGDKMTVWVSDYTENSTFYQFSFGGKELSEGRDGDPYGYLTKFAPPSTASGSEWRGPYGRRSMQLTIYDPHISYIRERSVTYGDWVLIKNLHIKLGHNAANLEGALREDRSAHRLKINISLLDPRDHPETINPQLKAALRRKRDYERVRKAQLKDITEAAKAGQKRKAAIASETELKANAKVRRKQLRAQTFKEAPKDSPKEDESPPTVDVNPSGETIFLHHERWDIC